MKVVLVLIVGMFCLAWASIEFSHDAVKNRELDMQLEIAKAINTYSKPGLTIRPGDSDGTRLRQGYGAPREKL